MNLPLFNLFRYEKTEAVQDIIEQATPRNEFYLMNAIAAIVSVTGLFQNNMPLILGSMLIAPLLSPVFAGALGIVTQDWKLARNSFGTVLLASTIAFVFATLTAAFLFGTGEGFPTEGYFSTIQPTVMLFGVSFLSGIAAATAVTNKQLNNILPGIAISVSLIPPLAATGIHLADQDWKGALYTGSLYFGSICFVALACVLVFYQMELQTQRREAEKKRQSEEKKEEQRDKKSKGE